MVCPPLARHRHPCKMQDRQSVKELHLIIPPLPHRDAPKGSGGGQWVQQCFLLHQPSYQCNTMRCSQRRLQHLPEEAFSSCPASRRSLAGEGCSAVRGDRPPPRRGEAGSSVLRSPSRRRRARSESAARSRGSRRRNRRSGLRAVALCHEVHLSYIIMRSLDATCVIHRTGLRAYYYHNIDG